MKPTYKQFLTALFYITPFFLGIYGFMQVKNSFSLEVIYSALRLYSFNMDIANGETAPLILWVAGFWAISVTATIIVRSFTIVYNYLSVRFSIIVNRKKTINVLGNPEYVELFKKMNENSTYKIISSEDNAAFRADKIVILGKNRLETLMIYSQVEEKIKAASQYKNQFANLKELVYTEVHLNVECLNSKFTSDTVKIHTIDFADNIARIFWRNTALQQQLQNKSHKIVFVGFGKLGQLMLTHSLQNNVTLHPQTLERVYHQYYVVGDFEKYVNLHKGLQQFVAFNEERNDCDSLYLIEELWQDFSIYEDADLIIFCDDDMAKNDEHAQTLIDHVPHKSKIYAYLEKATRSLYEKRNILYFPNFEELFHINIVLNDKLQEKAFHIHKAYKEKNSNQNVVEWSDLDDFSRRSNEASAEHIAIKELLIENTSDCTNLIEPLAILEHERWCRFHWLNNWRYTDQQIVVNGEEKTKDSITRKHKALVPYENLSEKMKQDLILEATKSITDKK